MRRSVLTLLIVSALTAPSGLVAETIPQGTVAGGGGTVGGDALVMSATIGQIAVGRTEGGHVLEAGFWHLPGVTSTAIHMSSFSVERMQDRTVVRWRVFAMDGPCFFHVWRQESDADRIRLTATPLTGSGSFEFADTGAPAGELKYWLEEIENGETIAWYGPTILSSIPLVFDLAPNHPNPFNPRTTLRYALPEPGRVRLAIHDLRGRLVRVLVDESQPAGWHTVIWDGRDDRDGEVASGVYVSRLQGSGSVKTDKLLLNR